MKKNYIQPSIEAYKIKATDIIATSEASIDSKGFNTDPEVPKAAETKLFDLIEDLEF